MPADLNLEFSIQAWLEKATEDDLACVSLIEHGRARPASACFHAQQMADKYLKALLAASELKVKKTHDLRVLATLLKDVFPEVLSFEIEFTILNKYAITSRYPGDFPEGFTWADAQEAYDAAVKIKDFVMSKINVNSSGPSVKPS